MVILGKVAEMLRDEKYDHTIGAFDDRGYVVKWHGGQVLFVYEPKRGGFESWSVHSLGHKTKAAEAEAARPIPGIGYDDDREWFAPDRWESVEAAIFAHVIGLLGKLPLPKP